MNWQLLPQFVVTGLLLGGPLALNALGIVLIFKSTYIFNFAQGQMLLLGALSTWWFVVVQGLPLWLAIILALILSAILGFLIERFTLRPLTGQHLLVIILMTLGLSQVLQGLALLLFGSVQRNFPQIFSTTAPYKIITPFIFNGNNITIGGDGSVAMGSTQFAPIVLNGVGSIQLGHGTLSDNWSVQVGPNLILCHTDLAEIGFFSATPVVQPASADQTALGAATTIGTSTGTPAAGLSLIGDTATVDQSAALMNDLASLRRDIANAYTLINAIRLGTVNLGLLKGAA